MAIGSFRGTNGNQPYVWWAENIADLNTLVHSSTSIVVDDPRALSDGGTIMAVGMANGVTCTLLLQPTPASIAAIHGNCHVDIDDLVSVILDWGKSKSPADVNHDDTVNIDDLIIVITEWST